MSRLSAIGTPGGIALLGPYSRRQSATDLLTVGGEGAARAVVESGAAVVAGRRVSQELDSEPHAVV